MDSVLTILRSGRGRPAQRDGMGQGEGSQQSAVFKLQTEN